MNAARTEILSRVAAALHGAHDAAPVYRRYRRTRMLNADAVTKLFCERVSEYKAEVRRVSAADVAGTVAGVCFERGARRLVVPSDLPAEWRPDEVDLVDDTAFTPRQLDDFDGVLTGCTLAIAETGTIALTAGASEGRRALTLVPDLHICVVSEGQIVEHVPEAMALLGRLVARERRPITLISGPSATSDIELTRVEGVHGPRSLVILVASKETE